MHLGLWGCVACARSSERRSSVCSRMERGVVELAIEAAAAARAERGERGAPRRLLGHARVRRAPRPLLGHARMRRAPLYGQQPALLPQAPTAPVGGGAQQQAFSVQEAPAPPEHRELPVSDLAIVADNFTRTIHNN